MSYHRYATLALLASNLLACKTVRNHVAVTEEYLHAQPPTYMDFDRGKGASFVTRQGHPVKIHCVQNRFGYKPDKGSHPGRPDDECLYFSVAMDDVPKEASNDAGERDDVVGILTTVSDMNCGNYLFRVFASKSGLDTGRNIIKDLSTAVAAGSAPFAPIAASGLSLTNLFVGTTVDNINSTYYFEKTFQAMETAISEERLRRRRQLFEKRGKSIAEYPFMDAWSDVRAYADACSIQRGLARLIEMTGEKKADAADDLQAVVDPAHSTKARIAELNQQVAKLEASQQSSQAKAAAEAAQKSLNQISLEATASALVSESKAREMQIEKLNTTIRELQLKLPPPTSDSKPPQP